MEDVIMGLGWAAIILSAIIGALAGWGVSKIVGGHRGRYITTGVLAAVAVPVVLGLIGLSIVAVGGLLAIAAVALVGAGIFLLIAKMIFD